MQRLLNLKHLDTEQRTTVHNTIHEEQKDLYLVKAHEKHPLLHNQHPLLLSRVTVVTLVQDENPLLLSRVTVVTIVQDQHPLLSRVTVVTLVQDQHPLTVVTIVQDQHPLTVVTIVQDQHSEKNGSETQTYLGSIHPCFYSNTGIQIK